MTIPTDLFVLTTFGCMGYDQSIDLPSIRLTDSGMELRETPQGDWTPVVGVTRTPHGTVIVEVLRVDSGIGWRTNQPYEERTLVVWVLTVEQFQAVVEDPDDTRIQAILAGDSPVDRTMIERIRAILNN